ncbi:MAG: hypothetical protein K2Y29_01185 [Beijerinckiaceae bacterium]|nr:hypothetical protein [Beijerinckiaceae bacterium]
MKALVLIIAALMSAALAAPVMAQDRPDTSWWDTPEVRRCCSLADAVYADNWRANPDGSITAIVTGGGPRDHAWAPTGREYHVTADRIITIPGNPTGRALLFLQPSTLSLFCFAPGPMI